MEDCCTTRYRNPSSAQSIVSTLCCRGRFFPSLILRPSREIWTTRKSR
uniref:Uncharacterized protein n=1 Tax=Picea sitchensis TaxID=3332 RepID=A9NQY9_PICSI|nr:unknown [Picea sitchensis]